MSIQVLETIPVGPNLSIWAPIYLGVNEYGEPVYLHLVGRNMLAAGEPGGGKSGCLQCIVGHAALSTDTRLVLFDGKLVELGPYYEIADEFIGPNEMTKALTTLRRLQMVMNNRYTWLLANRRRKIEPRDGLRVIVIVIDEIAYYTTVIGKDHEQNEFIDLLRDLVARGRACGMPVVAATQRPSIDVIPKSLRDLFAYRAAFRCTSSGSSDIILGDGWSSAGFNAADIPGTEQARGTAYLITEGGIPRLMKGAYLTDTQIYGIADYAEMIRDAGTLSATQLLKTA